MWRSGCIGKSGDIRARFFRFSTGHTQSVIPPTSSLHPESFRECSNFSACPLLSRAAPPVQHCSRRLMLPARNAPSACYSRTTRLFFSLALLLLLLLLPAQYRAIRTGSYVCVCVWRGVFFFLVSLIICIRQQRAGIDGQLGEYTACIHIPAPRTRGGRAASTTRAHTHIAHTHSTHTKKRKPKAGLSSNPERNREGGGKQKI